MLVAWVLCVVLCRVEMLKIVFVCVSRFLCCSSYFSFSKLFRLPQVVSGYRKFYLVV